MDRPQRPYPVLYEDPGDRKDRNDKDSDRAEKVGQRRGPDCGRLLRFRQKRSNQSERDNKHKGPEQALLYGIPTAVLRSYFRNGIRISAFPLDLFQHPCTVALIAPGRAWIDLVGILHHKTKVAGPELLLPHLPDPSVIQNRGNDRDQAGIGHQLHRPDREQHADHKRQNRCQSQPDKGEYLHVDREIRRDLARLPVHRGITDTCAVFAPADPPRHEPYRIHRKLRVGLQNILYRADRLAFYDILFPNPLRDS